MADLPASYLSRLSPEVLDYGNARFVLKDELHRLASVEGVGAPEAVIIYCARILETLTADALQMIGQSPSTNVFSNLQVLEQLNRIGTATCYWAHALRRLSNVVRHVDDRVGPEHAALSTFFAECWLDWFFVRFSHGPRLSRLTCDESPLGLGAGGQFRPLFGLLKELDDRSASLLTSHWQAEVESDSFYLKTPVIPAVLVEVLLGRKENAEALRVLTTALTHFPEDLRLRQLMGLYWSRTGDLGQALAWLDPLYSRFANDEETAGITAGAYKRQWLADRSNRTALEKSSRAYRQAWRSSSKNAYLGINAATTALWLGRRDESKRLAKEVETLLRRRWATLPADLTGKDLAFSYWDQVTLAEALLLLGDWSAAWQTYHEAFTVHAARLGDVEVSRGQLGELLKALSAMSEVIDGDLLLALRQEAGL
jgi:tetratricopeptide (TPR) repeat protein